MVISFAGIGAKAIAGTTSVAVAYPTPVLAGQLLITGRSIWNGTATASNLTGWTACGDLNSGTGTTVDAHSTRIRGDYRVAAGGETGTVSFAQANTPSGVAAQMVRYAKAPTTTWEITSTTAGDTSHGTNRLTGTSGTLSLQPGDLLVALVAVDTDHPDRRQLQLPRHHVRHPESAHHRSRLRHRQ